MTRVFLALIAFAMISLSARKPHEPEVMELIYVYDPLCGWCYGFSQVITAYAEAHPETRIKVVSGGMITGDRVGPLSEMASFLQNAYKDVEDRTGITFGQPFLDELFGDATMILDSDPSSRALAAMRALDPAGNRQVYFASALQRSIYFEGNAPNDMNAFCAIAESFGIDKDHFIEVYHSEAVTQRVQEDYKLSEGLKVSGFPTVFVRTGDEVTLLSRGYVDATTFSARIEDVMSRLGEPKLSD